MGLNLSRGHTVSCGCARKDGRNRLTLDITGERFGKLTALHRLESSKNGTRWLFRCDCGNEKEMLLQNVKSGKSTSCGFCKSSTSEKPRKQTGLKGVRFNLVGQRFDRLIAEERFVDGNAVKYLCRCDCGNECIKTTYSLLYQKKNSCGCLHRESLKKESLVGRKFNHLMVIGKAETRYGKLHWLCRCDCGNMTVVSSGGLISNHTRSCGCLQDIVASDTHFENLSGQRFGMLVAINRVENSSRGDVQYRCRCDCGSETIVRGVHLKNGNTQSCGCSVQPLGEKAVSEVLERLKLDYDTQIRFSDLVGLGNKQLSYDFGVYDNDGGLKFLIEYQGMQHYQAIGYFGGDKQFEIQQMHDELKREYAQNYLGVPLLEIPYSARIHEDIFIIVKSFLDEINAK